MSKMNSKDNLESFQLKECYDLAVQFEKHDTARDILREKSKKIDIQKNGIPIQAVCTETEMTLSSAEKEYILALLALRNGTNETQRFKALKHIRTALSDSPNDPRYIALAAVLQDAER